MFFAGISPFVGLFLVFGGASTVGAEALNEAMATAYFNNPELLAQRAALRATDEQMPQAFAGWLPNLDYTVSAGASAVFSNSGDNRRQHRESFSQALTLSQPLYSGGQTVAALNKAENTIMNRARPTISLTV